MIIVLSPGNYEHCPVDKRNLSPLILLLLFSIDDITEASNMILADDRHILAELDMYLTLEQFLSLYKPPEML